jgi:hypothetical protein
MVSDRFPDYNTRISSVIDIGTAEELTPFKVYGTCRENRRISRTTRSLGLQLCAVHPNDFQANTVSAVPAMEDEADCRVLGGSRSSTAMCSSRVGDILVHLAIFSKLGLGVWRCAKTNRSSQPIEFQMDMVPQPDSYAR